MSSGDDTGERNPFAPPPEDAPDQPWQPRGPRPGEGGVHGPSGDGGPGSGSGSGSGSGERPPFPPPWGAGLGDGRPGQRPPAPQPPRLDPSNPAHRRARNAALAGPLALVCLFLGLHWLALLVGLLGIVWGVSAMRTPKPAEARTGNAAYEPPAPNPLTPAALAGILTGAMTVVVTTSVIGLGLYYHEYETCVQDSLTSVGADNCDRYAPKWYVDFTGNAE
ncbi:hypothetical protein [Streptomyces sp. NRRL WC-3742]|uniref:hypothetical protein n=1 Tax=Streptomyces sp. NRRL WC-3742 TaxID=1463934 RepID=UPI0004C866AC|nr:hypothetical protein [Streptomyces sp. NRRL WC-3742]